MSVVPSGISILAACAVDADGELAYRDDVKSIRMVNTRLGCVQCPTHIKHSTRLRRVPKEIRVNGRDPPDKTVIGLSYRR